MPDCHHRWVVSTTCRWFMDIVWKQFFSLAFTNSKPSISIRNCSRWTCKTRLLSFVMIIARSWDSSASLYSSLLILPTILFTLGYRTCVLILIGEHGDCPPIPMYIFDGLLMIVVSSSARCNYMYLSKLIRTYFFLHIRQSHVHILSVGVVCVKNKIWPHGNGVTGYDSRSRCSASINAWYIFSLLVSQEPFWHQSNSVWTKSWCFPRIWMR